MATAQYTASKREDVLSAFNALLDAREAGDHDAARVAQKRLYDNAVCVKFSSRNGAVGPAGVHIDGCEPRACMPDGSAVRLINFTRMAAKLGCSTDRLRDLMNSADIPHFKGPKDVLLFDPEIVCNIALKRVVETGRAWP